MKPPSLLPETLAEYWEHRRIWDRWDVEMHERANEHVHVEQRELSVQTVRNLNASDLRILDLCCGTGKVTDNLLNLENVKEVVALDISQKALDILQDRLGRTPGFYKLKIVRANAMNPATLVELGSFDVIICLDAIHHLSDLQLALKLIYERLAGGGIFIGNCLARERVAQHVKRKRGILQFYFRNIRATVFRLLSWNEPLWNYAGYNGYLMSLLTLEELKVRLEELFIIRKLVSNDYHWFTVSRRENNV